MGAADVEEMWSPDAADVRAGLRALWWSVGPDGDLAVMLVHERHLRRLPHIMGWMGWGPELPFDGVVVIRAPDGSVRRRPIENIRVWPSHIALLPRSRLLVVGGRTRKEAGTWRPNAVVYSAEGERESTFCAGDDIPALSRARTASRYATGARS